MENIFEHNVVDILAQQVEQEPVAHGSLLHHHLHALGLHAPVAQLEQVSPQRGGEAERDPAAEWGAGAPGPGVPNCCSLLGSTGSSNSPVHNDQGGETGQDQHPEPEEDVDFLIENIERQDAESVMFLQVSRGSELVESTFCQPGHMGIILSSALWMKTESWRNIAE